MSDQIIDRTDPTWLNTQYCNINNLEDRVTLHRVCGSDKGKWYEWLFDLLKKQLAENVSLVEIGGGTGNLWLKNRENIPKGWNITFTDRSPAMIESLQAKMKEDTRFTFKIINGNDVIDIPDNSVDVVVANHVLYHLENVEEFLSEVTRILKPTGVFFASCTGMNHMQKMYNLVHEFNSQFTNYRVYRGFNLQNGKETLENSFSDVETIIPESKLTIDEEHIPLLVNYAFSVQDIKETIGESNKYDLHNFFVSKLEDGLLVIPKEEGVFIAKGIKKINE